MSEFVETLQFIVGNKVFITLAIVVILQLLSHQIIRLIRKNNDFLNEQHRTWISRTKNLKVFLMTFLLFILWWVELERFALSIAAVAIVIASKELILCLSGSILRAASNAFIIGDWIRVGDNYGEVIEHNILSTVVQEVDF